MNKMMARTVAATLGRIALAMPEQVSIKSQAVIKQWVLSLRLLTASLEREQAYRGFVLSLGYEHSRQAVTEHFPFMCACISAYKDAPQDLEQQFGQVVLFFA